MATAEPASGPHDRNTMRKRPFTGWMKRLANLKPSTSDSPNASGKKGQGAAHSKSKKSAAKNNPYPQSGHFRGNGNGHPSFSSPVSTARSNESFTSVEEASAGHQGVLATSNKSTAPTVATNPETIHSGRSKAETGHSNTISGGSTFSSPNHSDRSLTTTLTTIQSSAPSNVLAYHAQNASAANVPPVHFSHQFPTSPPPSAIPPHLAPQPHPHSYQAATAGGILTDNASILTLASSSKRRRRASLDTNASVRALAPSSMWGGSRDSLPLSVLSGNADNSTIYSPSTRPGVGGFANAERASLYSSSGVAAPALSSERNSYYASKQNADGVSVRSGLPGHGRTDSITGSIGATAASPLASPKDPVATGRMSRRSSDWKEAGEDSELGDDGESPACPEVEGKGKAPVV
ncbi:uncharacterized protein BDR25DRAFT_292970 [Lindgomyces ingoldianus]|uniref:Uncharacterized protein n=1 Tax=Lindgomyces ingoldianus TaxID=673940 RepID=A0ACB6QJD1_9PLEO|nr:uncharacterized protein BDR25DRAFT_292970 [Lindgomyces ingoldianus]KAF2467129.1 hypothetical protein BDR25DRAFT_292970 [Lindgomyces ingoldianus]